MRDSVRVALLWMMLAGVALASSPVAARNAASADFRASGSVRLETSCRPEVQEDFQTAVALLHSFFYEEARRRFEDIAERDPGCAMAWWGVAMTWYHPLWAAPNAEEMAAGSAAVERARAIGGKTDLERGFIAAIAAFFDNDEQPAEPGAAAMSCHGPRTHGARADAFQAALEKLHGQFPDNLEATVFYTLSLLATAPPTDRAFTNQKVATAILEPLFEQNPEHPGIPHYIIHAYDYPALAARGLVAARRYDDIAPWVPHALHMPSHIYTRLGMWTDSIEANLASAKAARDYTARVAGGAAWYDELHALDYLAFAYLQTAQDAKAAELLDYVGGLKKFKDPNFAAAYALGAIPARYTLERKRWSEAAALVLPHPSVVEPFPFAVAHVEFARAMGAARSGNKELAQQAIGRLAELRDSLEQPKFKWWVDQIEIQRIAASGWLARAEGRDADALELLQKAAELEDAAGTHPVTPGQILPAREQLGDLLLELDRPAEALASYERALEAFPRRFNGHYGAARAGQLADKPEVARMHYALLIEMAGNGDGRREELARAREYLLPR